MGSPSRRRQLDCASTSASAPPSLGALVLGGLGALALLGLGACGDETLLDGPPTTARVQAEIFSPQCALSGCHAGPTPAQGLDLTPPVEAKLVGVEAQQVTRPLVDPGNPGNSYLYDKVLGTMIAGTSIMPLPPQEPLTDAEIDLLREWILSL